MNNSVIEILQNQINETILSCNYNNFFCNSNDFSRVLHSWYGICIQYKASDNLKLTGSLNGFNLDIMLDPRNEKNHLNDHRGLVILKTNQTDYIDTNKAIYIPVKEKSSIEIKKIYVNNLPKPYTDCIKV